MKIKYLKCYNFKLKISGEIIGYVYATDEEFEELKKAKIESEDK